jgi:hypothetical protein
MTSSFLAPAQPSARQLLAGIGTTGLVAGALDITAACLQFTLQTQKNPVAVLKYVASGLLGPAALRGGTAMVLVGLLLHFVIAYLFAAAYFGLYPRLGLPGRRPVLAGVLYGSAVWLVMNLVVVPLSGTPKLPLTVSGAAGGLSILILCIGVPIALLTSRFYAGWRQQA